MKIVFSLHWFEKIDLDWEQRRTGYKNTEVFSFIIRIDESREMGSEGKADFDY